MDDSAARRIERLIERHLPQASSGPGISTDTPLLSSGLGLDSVALLEILVEIETEFGVQFPDSEITGELFRSIGTLASAVERKIARTAG